MFARALLVLALLTSTVLAADPPKAVAPLDLDRTAEAVLKDVHDRGADLYNAADAAGAFRMYEGMLRTVGPFLAHRPAVQKAIEDGLTAAAKQDGVKAKAFRLHEVIEQVRADLKAEIKKGEAGVKPAEPPGKLFGVVNLDGQPLANVSVTVVSLDRADPLVVTAVADGTGQFAFAAPLPVGRYAAMVTDDAGGKVPAKYHTTRTSGLTLTVKGGDNGGALNLQSK